LANWACAKLTSLPAAPRDQPPIVGGLLASQLLTLFTTPVVYIDMGKLREALSRPPHGAPARQQTAAAVEGRLPRGYGLKRLVDLPMAGPDQWPAPGLQTPART
jgi:hypothetical protein